MPIHSDIRAITMKGPIILDTETAYCVKVSESFLGDNAQGRSTV